MKKITCGQGRVEYLAHRETIQSRLNQGYTLFTVYNQMKEENKISMSYGRLAYYIRKEKGEKKEKQAEASIIVNEAKKLPPKIIKSENEAKEPSNFIKSESTAFSPACFDISELIGDE